VKVSTIIPTYNRSGELLATVESALAQTYPDFEVIVVNDGSDDDTREVAEGIDDPRVTVIHHPHNRGVAAARNTGIGAARGVLLAFLDDDDRWMPDKLAKQVPLFADPAIGLVYCGVAIVDERGKVAWQVLPTRRGDIYKALLFKNYPLTGSVVVTRRACFEQLGTFDQKLPPFEDHDMWLRIARRYRVDFVPEALTLFAGFWHDRLNRPSQAVHVYHRVIEKLETYEYPSLLCRRRVRAYRHYTLATMHGANGDARLALQSYFRSLAIWPGNPKAWIGLMLAVAGQRASRALTRLKARLLALVNGVRASR
jgi:glycosyltransferase involved in cell wall biosynthesis